MFKHSWIILTGTALLATTEANAAGFALYEGSAEGVALGGAVMGRAIDASANFYNPATIDDFTNSVITVGTIMEIPQAIARVNGHSGGRIRPGGFLLPHAYVVQPLGYGFTFGLGFAPEYGLGSKFRDFWPMRWNTTETTVEGFVVNPNLTYAITPDWSVSAGLRILSFTFDQRLDPYAAQGGTRYGQLHSHLKGDNDFSDFGWQLSTRYRITSTLAAGLMYHSYIDTTVKGDANTHVTDYDYSSIPSYLRATPYYGIYRSKIQSSVDSATRAVDGSASADIRLPQSVTFGLNWDALKTLHFGGATTWTRWSSMDALDFRMPGGTRSTALNWHDVFRFTLAGAWDFAEDWSLMASYVFDIDPCDKRPDIGSTMLPRGDRHIGSIGLSWRWHGFTVAACFGIVFMESEKQTFHDGLGNTYRFSAENGFSRQFGLSVSYAF